MDFLLVGILILWSLGACFLPVREKILRSLFTTNSILLGLAIIALAVPILSGSSVSVLEGLIVGDKLRALLAIPLAIAWMIAAGAFVLWWGASFKSGTGTRLLFCLRSFTFIGAFAGILLMLFTDAPVMMLGGLLLTFVMTAVGALFQISETALKHIQRFIIGCGMAIAVFTIGVALLVISGFQQTGELLLTHAAAVQASMSGVSTLALLGVAITGFSMMWFMGLLPGLAWYRRGIASLPRGQRLVMRVMLPVGLFPHVITLAGWGGEGGVLFVQKLFLVGGFFGALTLLEYLYAKEAVEETSVILILTMALTSFVYGPAGVIPALMLVMILVLLGTLFMMTRGGLALKSRARSYASLVLMGVPVVSPLFIPYTLSVGYGIQMMPAVASIAVMILIYATATLAVRVYRAWSESDQTYADVWSSRLAMVLMVIITAYGCWFMYTDALALVVKSAGVGGGV